MALHITFTTLTPDAMDRMLKDVASNEAVRQLPLHKRKKAREEKEDDEEDEDDKYAEDDRKARADLVEATRPGNAPEVTPADLPSLAMPKAIYKKAQPYSKKASKKK